MPILGEKFFDQLPNMEPKIDHSGSYDRSFSNIRNASEEANREIKFFDALNLRSIERVESKAKKGRL